MRKVDLKVGMIPFSKQEVSRALKDGEVVDIVPTLIAKELVTFMDEESKKVMRRCQATQHQIQGSRFIEFGYISQATLLDMGVGRETRNDTETMTKSSIILMPVKECLADGLKYVLAQALAERGMVSNAEDGHVEGPT